MRWLLLILVGCGRLGFDPTSGMLGDGGARDASIVGTDVLASRVNNLVFITSTPYTGNLGGTSGADAICQMHADNAGLGGTFVSFNTMAPADRLVGSTGWIDVAGKPIADDPSLWLIGNQIHPIWRDELGIVHTVERSWLGDGCTGWTSESDTIASLAVTTLDLLYVTANITCDTPLRLICAEVGRTAPLTLEPVAGRRAFVTLDVWTPGSDLAGADAFCMMDAANAGVIGTFQALLATSTMPALGRFSLTGPPWTRMDGIPMAPTAMAFTKQTHDAFWTIANGNGVAIFSADFAWRGTDTENCLDWGSAQMNRTGSVGSLVTVDHSVLDYIGVKPCTANERLICLEP